MDASHFLASLVTILPSDNSVHNEPALILPFSSSNG